MDLRKLLETHAQRWTDEMQKPNCDHETLADKIQTLLADEGYVVSQEDIQRLVEKLSKSVSRKALVDGLVHLVEN
jgi:hypothetical protein